LWPRYQNSWVVSSVVVSSWFALSDDRTNLSFVKFTSFRFLRIIYKCIRCHFPLLIQRICYRKGKGRPLTFLCRYRREAEVYLKPIHIPAQESGGWSTIRSGRFIPRKGPVPFVQEAGWVSLWMGLAVFGRGGKISLSP
jgi:hypothetical protein